jgi:hypothetical protein
MIYKIHHSLFIVRYYLNLFVSNKKIQNVEKDFF